MPDVNSLQAWLVGGIGITVGVILFIVTFVFGAIECARGIVEKRPAQKKKHFINLGINIIFLAIGLSLSITIPIFREIILSWMSHIGG